MKQTAIGLCLLFITTATLRAAQEFVPRLSDGPHIGLVTGGDVEDDAFAYGWQVAYHASPVFSLHLAVTLHEDEVRPELLSGLGVSPEAGIDLDVAALALTGRINLWETNRGLIYTGAGIGYYLLNSDVDTVDQAIDQVGAGSPVVDFDADIHKEFGYHFSLGTTVHLGRHWNAFLDGRYVLLDSDVTYTLVRPVGNGVLEDQRIDDKIDYDHVLLRVGVNYRF